MAGWSGLEDSGCGPRLDFCCLREWRELPEEWRELPEESRVGDPIEASFFEWRRLECFELSEPLLVGELTGEPRLVE